MAISNLYRMSADERAKALGEEPKAEEPKQEKKKK